MTAMSYDREHGYPATSAPSSADGRGNAGLLHDLGHQMMTVSLLAESLSADNELSEQSRRRSELLVQETARALGMIADGMPGGPAPQEDETQLIDIRQLAGQLARLARIAHPAAITLLPGSPAYLQVNPMQVWRVLWNLIDNAARAAGPDGHVEVAIRRGDGTIIEVTDDGPGYGGSSPGVAGLGLSVVRQLLASSGGQLSISTGPAGGTRVSAAFGGRCDRILLPPMRQTPERAHD